ncbi:MAG: hypothetical protein ABIL50_08255 [candidate division WOR-3 bacterium]
MFVIKCPECESYMVKKHSENPLRFKCKLCHNTFSLNIPSINHEGQAKRLSSLEIAKILADLKLGKSENEILSQYGISRATLYRIKDKSKSFRWVFTWRLNYGSDFEFLKNEALKGRLRQGWGWCDLRKGIINFADAWKKLNPNVSNEEIEKRFNILKVMILANPGDIVLVPKFNGSHTFMLAKIKNGYNFSFPPGYNDYGHYVEIEGIKVFSSTFESPEDAKVGFNLDVQIINEFLRTTKRFYTAISVMGDEYSTIIKVLENLLNPG